MAATVQNRCHRQPNSHSRRPTMIPATRTPTDSPRASARMSGAIGCIEDDDTPGIDAKQGGLMWDRLEARPPKALQRLLSQCNGYQTPAPYRGGWALRA